MDNIDNFNSYKFFKNVTFAETEDLTIILDSKRGIFFEANKTASEIIKRMQKGLTVKGIQDQLKERYKNFNPEDVSNFIEELLRNEFIYLDER